MKKIKYIFKKIIFIFVIAIISIFIYRLYEEIKSNTENPNTYGTKLSAEENLEDDNPKQTDTAKMIKEISKCVVGISKIKNSGSTVFMSNVTESLGLGTGVIISKNGYILTNYHVAGKNGENCYVTTEDGSIENGQVIWSSSEIDLAIIKVSKRFNTVAKFGNSEGIYVGENVYAIGNPIGYEFQRTVTSGIISAKDRTIKIKNDDETYSYMNNLIQTDATINPGNSGGPLIDYTGQIIGINSVKIDSAEGIGFAIPINIVKPILEKIEKNENFKEAYIGIMAYDGSVMAYVNGKLSNSQGVYVDEIIKKSPAEKAGLMEEDLIIKVDETNVNKMVDLQEYIFKKNPEDEIEIYVIRNNEKINLKLILGEKYENNNLYDIIIKNK